MGRAAHLASLVVAGCGTAAPDPTVVVTPPLVVPVPTSAGTDAAARAGDDRDVAHLSRPISRLTFDGPAACELSGDLAGTSTTLETADGTPFASVSDGDWNLRIPPGAWSRSEMRLTTLSLSLRGYTRDPLYFVSPTWVGGFYIAQGRQPVTIVTASSAAVETLIRVPGEIFTTAETKTTVVCGELSAAGNDDYAGAADALGVTGPAPFVVSTRPEPIPFALDAKGPMVGTLDAGDDLMQLVGKQGSRVRVAKWMGAGLFVGWVAANRIKKSTEEAGVVWQQTSSPPSSRFRPRNVTCGFDVPVHVGDGHQWLEVGVIRKGVPFDARPADPGTWETVLSGFDRVELLTKLHLLDVDVRRCTQEPVPPPDALEP